MIKGNISMNLGVDHPKAAIIAIDLHPGHLDMELLITGVKFLRARDDDGGQRARLCRDRREGLR